MSSPHRIQFLPRRQPRVRCIPSQGSAGWGRSYTPMNQLSQPETATPIISSRPVTLSSHPAPHKQRMGMGNPLSFFGRKMLRLPSGCNGYDSCISCNNNCTSSLPGSPWSSGGCPRSRSLASAKSTQSTAGIKYPGQWFANDEARSTRWLMPFNECQPPFRHYLSHRRTQLGAPQH